MEKCLIVAKNNHSKSEYEFYCTCNNAVMFQSNWTPMMIAASAGRTQIVANLIGHGAQVNAVNRTGQCPLHYAASKDRYEVRHPYI